MSIATITAEDVEKAVYEVLDEVVDLLEPLFGHEAVARLLNLSGDGCQAMHDYFESDPTARDPNRFKGVGEFASSLFAYAWQGNNHNGWHPDSSWPEVFTLGEVSSALTGRVQFDLEHRNGDTFGDVHINGNRAVDIVKWVVDAYKARGRIDSIGGDMSIEELAALAKVSEKTIRMAANPKIEGALKTIKRGHRTFVTATDAMDWLARRPDFIPTRNPTKTFLLDLHIGGSARQLSAFLQEVVPDQVRARKVAILSGMNELQCDALFSGDLPLADLQIDPEPLQRFAEQVGIDRISAFVRWVLDLQYRERLERIEADYRRQVSSLSAIGDGEGK